MGEYLIQSETLTSIADTIRAKTEKTDSLTPADMVTSIEELIKLPTAISKIDAGAFTTTSSDYSNYVVEHNLGEAPDFVLVIYNALVSSSTSSLNCLYYWAVKKTYYSSSTKYFGRYKYDYISSSSIAAGNGSFTSTSVETYFTSTNFTINRNLAPSAPYVWICGKFADFAG